MMILKGCFIKCIELINNYKYNVLIYSISLIYFVSALDAYQICEIPINSISIIFISLLFFMILPNETVKLGKVNLLLLFLFVCSIITSFILNSHKIPFYANNMPLNYPYSYFFFVIYRFVILLAYLMTCYILFTFDYKHNTNSLITAIGIIGTAVAIISLYIYYAQIYGLPDFYRNRLGTGGGAQPAFYGSYHRAMGTFREPSLLAQWLALPFFVSLIKNNLLWSVASILILVVVLLTHSLTGFIGITIGLAVTFTILVMRRNSHIKLLLYKLFCIVSLSVSIVSCNDGYGLGAKYNFERLLSLLSKGVKSTNRGYIYDNSLLIDDNEKNNNSGKTIQKALFGSGIGNASIDLSIRLKSNSMPSHLNLFLFYAKSGGLLSAIILVMHLLYPYYSLLVLIEIQKNSTIIALVAGAYCSLLIMGLANLEELSISLAISYALLVLCMNWSKSEGQDHA